MISSSPSSLLIVIRSDWKWWLFGAIFSFILASVLMTGWPSGLMPNIDYPFTYNNDGAFGAIQRLIEGWIFDNPRSGYPFGSNLLDYPSSDSGNYLVLKLIGLLTGEWYSAHNIYFLLGFAVTFVASFSVLRAVGLTIPFAFTAATLFDFLPFHFQRISHLFLTWYFVIPIFYYIALKIFNTEFIDKNTPLSPPKKIFYAMCLLFLGSFGVYYAIFGLIILTVIAIAALIGNHNFNAFKLAFLASCFVVLGVLLNLAPNLIHRYTNGPNLEVAQRSFAESEIYGFKFAQLVLPRNGHRNANLARISAKYSNATPLINENITSTLGAVGTLGLLALLVVIFSNLSGRPQDQTLNVISLIVLVLFMFGTIGGFGSIFAQTITSSIRGWNRISVFISFGALLGLFILLQAALRKRFAGRRYNVLTILVSIIFLFGGLYDQTVPACKACNEQIKRAFSMDRDFVRSIEKSMPVGSAIYQLPYMPFPEVPPLHRLNDYVLSVGFLYSTSLHWSYGGMKGRTGDLFYRSLANEPLKRQLEVIKKLGFAGIYVDRRGYDDNDLTVINGLTALLGSPPALARADGEVVFFSLNQDQHVNLEGLNSEQLMKKAGYIPNQLGPRYPATFAEGIDFTRHDFPNFVDDVVGLSGSEPWGRWSEGSFVKFRFDEALPRKFTLELTASAFGPNIGAPVRVRVGGVEKTFVITEQKVPGTYRLTFDTDGTADTLEFTPPKPTSPNEIDPKNGDTRKLGIGFISLKIKE